MTDRFEIGGTPGGIPAGPQPVANRPARQPGLREMQRDRLRLHFRNGRIMLFESSRDASMDLLPLAPQEALVRDVLHQRMFEAVTNLRGYATPEHELRLQQLVESTLKTVLIERRDHFQEDVRELAPDTSRDLSDFLDRSQPVQAGHERVLERRRDRQRRQRTCQLVAAGPVLDEAGFGAGPGGAPR